MRCGVKVPDLQLAEQTDTDHLDSGEDEDAGHDKERAMHVHDVLTGKNFEDEQPRC